jgi:hypothetical protein
LAAGKQLGLRPFQRIARRKQLLDGAALGADELVDGPCSDRRLAHRRDPRRLVAPPVGAQLFGERVALGREALER